MLRWTFAAIFILIVWALPAAADECASNLTELKKTPRLESILALFKDTHSVGLVNETKGSYVVIEAYSDGQLKILFYTSGIWDLYGIKDEGLLLFCDGPEGLVMSGLGRKDALKISPGKMEIGKGGPRQTFHVGPAPELLRKLHGLNGRAIASEE